MWNFAQELRKDQVSQAETKAEASNGRQRTRLFESTAQRLVRKCLPLPLTHWCPHWCRGPKEHVVGWLIPAPQTITPRQAQRFGLSSQEKEDVSAFKSENVSQHEDRVAPSTRTLALLVHEPDYLHQEKWKLFLTSNQRNINILWSHRPWFVNHNSSSK